VGLAAKHYWFVFIDSGLAIAIFFLLETVFPKFSFGWAGASLWCFIKLYKQFRQNATQTRLSILVVTSACKISTAFLKGKG